MYRRLKIASRSYKHLSNWRHPFGKLPQSVRLVLLVGRIQQIHSFSSMKKQGRKTPSYLDVTDYMLTGPFSPKISPVCRPMEPEIIQNPTPLSRPLYIEMPEGNPSPYLKELLSKVGGVEVEFWDFTLQGPNEDDDLDKEQYQQQLPKQKQMSVIEEEQEEEKASPSQIAHGPTFEYNPDEYIPNMHLLDIDPSALKIQHFNETMETFKHSSDEEKREFISLYLTDQDLDVYKDADTKKLIEVVHSNLSIIGVISRLERKAKVSRYLQKKKRRIWRKKINYDCRKKVADNRLRVKGKFVTREQACAMLGIDTCTQEQLKELLKTNYHKLMF